MFFGELYIFCLVIVVYSYLLSILDCFCVEYLLVEIKFIIGDVVDVMEKVVIGEVDLVIAGKLEILFGVVAFLMLENLVVVLIVFVLFCSVCN